MADDSSNPEEDADAAAEWEKMLASGEGGGEAEETGRVLNQDEIDLLLGFDSKDSSAGEASGIQAILGKSLMAYEKLPMMEVVFDRLVRILSSSMRNFTSDNVDVSIDSMTSLRFDDYLNSIPLPALLTVFRAAEWENFGLVTVDSSLIYSSVDVLLGGRRSQRPIRIEGRPYTTIEQDIVKNLVDIILSDMSSAFDPLSPVTFQHERLENNPRFATITRPNNAALLIRLRIDMDDRGGIVEILFPHTTLEPIRDLLMQIFMGEKFGQDSVWEKHLGKEVRMADVDVRAVLDEKTVPIGDIIRLKVGSTILLDVSPQTDVWMQCGEIKLTKAKLGRMGDRMAVSLVDAVSRSKVKELA
ncbi:MAG: flagellar motor switch protein FliM [Rickettsiales bacterium]|nr:flagellar motor switch protein FliM [Rickettsiales bacterium]